MYDTIIVGAGIAGLAAGQHFHKKKEDNFIILECADKIGGRCQTIEFGGRIFSIGPGWVHGKLGNPIYDILTELKVSMEVSKIVENEILFVWDTVENKDVTKSFIERKEQINEIVQNIGEKFAVDDIESQKSFRDILSENTNLYNSMSDFDRTILYTSMEIYLGAPLNEVSAIAELRHDEIYDDDAGIVNHRITDPLGTTKLIEFLCKDYKEKIYLNCKVKTIEWNNNEEPNQVRIILEDGREYSCKNVIITVQSNLLLNHSITFKPELPDEKTDSWKYVPAVNYCRLFAKFPEKFWPNKEWLIPVIKDVEPTNELILWQNCESQNLCSENDNILICHVATGHGNGSSRFDKVDKETLIEIVTDSMKKMFPETYCKPLDVLFVTFWNGDRFAGSFSQPCPGFKDSHIEDLKDNVGPLYFAGESIMAGLMGTMQAAYISGKNAAKNILI